MVSCVVVPGWLEPQGRISSHVESDDHQLLQVIDPAINPEKMEMWAQKLKVCCWFLFFFPQFFLADGFKFVGRCSHVFIDHSSFGFWFLGFKLTVTVLASLMQENPWTVRRTDTPRGASRMNNNPTQYSMPWSKLKPTHFHTVLSTIGDS